MNSNLIIKDRLQSHLLKYLLKMCCKSIQNGDFPERMHQSVHTCYILFVIAGLLFEGNQISLGNTNHCDSGAPPLLSSAF